MRDATVLSSVGIATLGVIESVCLLTGNDGTYLLPIAGLISGIAGFTGGIAYAKKVK